MITKNIIDYQDKKLNFLPKIFFPKVLFINNLSKVIEFVNQKNTIIFASKSAWERNQNIINISKELVFIIHAEPSINEIENIIKRIIKDNKIPEVIIAIGGGSAIDAAKFVKEKLKTKLVAIPTTPGTGTEATPFVVLTDSVGHKQAQNNPDFLPDIVILEASLIASVPKKYFGPMLIDAFSHTVEAFFSRFSNTFSDSLAVSNLSNFKICLKAKDKSENKYFERIQSLGFIGGLCQATASTGLTHALAHYFGPLWKISHSLAITQFIKKVILLNAKQPIVANKLKTYSLTAKDLIKIINEIEKIYSYKKPKIILPKNFDETKAINYILHDVCMLTNPYRPTEKELTKLIRSVVN
jgi:1-propanol dehydrogenase